MNRDNDKGKVLIRRSMVMATGMLVLLLVIIARLYFLQVIYADRFKMMADENRISTRILVPPRGIIYDRNMVPIAMNQQNFQALIVAEQTTDVKSTLDEFSKIMPLSDEEIERIKKDLKKNKSFVPIKIKEKLTWEEISKILLKAPDLPGIIIDEGLNRFYPHGDMMAHVLGYVAAVNEEDLKKKDDPLLEVPGFKIGKSGIEKLFEKRLRGKGGNVKLEVNAYGRIMKEIEKTEGIPGENIVLTIDARLQEATFHAFKEESGAAILLDVNTGEILAFVSMPSFDPNLLSQGLSKDDWNALIANPKKPMTNKAIAGQYSPGSTFKMIVALAALETRTVALNTRVFCSGQMYLGNHAFHCWKKDGHGFVNIIEALEHSCDTFFYELSLKLGIDRIAAMARRFGLGSKVDIGFDGEREGLIPDREWKMKRFKETWQQGESLISGIGQGYVLTTPIQLAVMTSSLVNGGYKVQPTFVKREGDVKTEDNKIKVSNANLEIVKEGMYAVVNNPRGTAYWYGRFDYNGMKMGGKTGTTQVRRITMKERQTGVLKSDELPWHLRNHALFVGYAPHDNPKYAVAILVEHGGGGSSAAAPIAKKILLEAVKLDPSQSIQEVRE
ncbi:MAG: penicillin-binding protein 2 [Lactobacillus sp.]|jgi:penicillin-binding protein 2|nr:penicillin-binding protein 2 [Lactobacillus sp.]